MAHTPPRDRTRSRHAARAREREIDWYERERERGGGGFIAASVGRPVDQSVWDLSEQPTIYKDAEQRQTDRQTETETQRSKNFIAESVGPSATSMGPVNSQLPAKIPSRKRERERSKTETLSLTAAALACGRPVDQSETCQQPIVATKMPRRGHRDSADGRGRERERLTPVRLKKRDRGRGGAGRQINGERQTLRQTDRQTDRQTKGERQTDRQTKGERQTLR